jgi:hypothetical protein
MPACILQTMLFGRNHHVACIPSAQQHVGSASIAIHKLQVTCFNTLFELERREFQFRNLAVGVNLWGYFGNGWFLAITLALAGPESSLLTLLDLPIPPAMFASHCR